MKRRLNSILMAAALLANSSVFARAEETNETKQPPKQEKKVFIFEGGNPIDFILAMDRHFRMRLDQILSIPSSLAHARVPKMKIRTEKPDAPLRVYNSLQDPTLGQWRYDPPGGDRDAWDPSVLALVPDKDVALKSGARVKALSLRGLPDSTWNKLQEDIEVARMSGVSQAEKLGGDRYEGSIHIQRESRILIAAGSDGFIEMVESVVAAHRDNSNLNH
jgi:hypothetical protein